MTDHMWTFILDHDDVPGGIALHGQLLGRK